MKSTNERIMELIAQGKNNAEIEGILKKEGVKNARGKPFTRKTIEMRRLRLKDKDKLSEVSDLSDIRNTCDLLSEIAEKSGNLAEADSGASRSLDTETSEVSDQTIPTIEPAAATGETLPEKWKEEIVQLIHREFDSFIHSPDISIHRQAPDESTYDLPPIPQDKIPGASGRPVNPGKRVKIAGTVDAELDRLFQEWRDSRGMSLSRALDTALWYFLGKPKLSFEVSED
jgi:hypothetical protein